MPTLQAYIDHYHSMCRYGRSRRVNDDNMCDDVPFVDDDERCRNLNHVLLCINLFETVLGMNMITSNPS